MVHLLEVVPLCGGRSVLRGS